MAVQQREIKRNQTSLAKLKWSGTQKTASLTAGRVMNNKKLWIALLIVAISALPIAVVIMIQKYDLLRPGNVIHFHTDYQEALAEAKLTNKPLFVEFRCDP